MKNSFNIIVKQTLFYVVWLKAQETIVAHEYYDKFNKKYSKKNKTNENLLAWKCSAINCQEKGIKMHQQKPPNDHRRHKIKSYFNYMLYIL